MEDRPLIMSKDFSQMIDIKNSGAKGNYSYDINNGYICGDIKLEGDTDRKYIVFRNSQND